jgi:hypothetical protein
MTLPPVATEVGAQLRQAAQVHERGGIWPGVTRSELGDDWPLDETYMTLFLWATGPEGPASARRPVDDALSLYHRTLPTPAETRRDFPMFAKRAGSRDTAPQRILDLLGPKPRPADVAAFTAAVASLQLGVAAEYHTLAEISPGFARSCTLETYSYYWAMVMSRNFLVRYGGVGRSHGR